MTGYRRTASGKTIFVADREWFIQARNGKPFISEPFLSRSDNKFVTVFAVPLRDDNNAVSGVLACSIGGEALSDIIDDIKVGETGNCYVLGTTGNTIADVDREYVQSLYNAVEAAKTDPSLASFAALEKLAVESETPGIGYYTYDGTKKIAGYAKSKLADWTVVLKAPYNEFMGTVNTLSLTMDFIGLTVLILTLATIYLSLIHI